MFHKTYPQITQKAESTTSAKAFGNPPNFRFSLLPSRQPLRLMSLPWAINRREESEVFAEDAENNSIHGTTSIPFVIEVFLICRNLWTTTRVSPHRLTILQR
jgi:hypothetical protein